MDSVTLKNVSGGWGFLRAAVAKGDALVKTVKTGLNSYLQDLLLLLILFFLWGWKCTSIKIRGYQQTILSKSMGSLEMILMLHKHSRVFPFLTLLFWSSFLTSRVQYITLWYAIHLPPLLLALNHIVYPCLSGFRLHLRSMLGLNLHSPWTHIIGSDSSFQEYIFCFCYTSFPRC